MPDDLQISSRTTTFVGVRGAVDAHTAPRLRAALVEILAAGHRDLVLDLGHVDFMDSSGLSVILTAHQRVSSDSGSLRVLNASSGVLKIFRITGLGAVVDVRGRVGDPLHAAAVSVV